MRGGRKREKMNVCSLEIILDTVCVCVSLCVSGPTFLSHRQVGVTAGFTRTNHLMEQRALEVHRLQRKRKIQCSCSRGPDR